MCSTRDNAALPTLGLPIRESADQWLFSASPRLIAAVHALHRLLVPRHPPCALTILTVIGETLASSPSEKSLISPEQFAVRRIALIPVHWLLCSFQGPRRGASCPSPAPDRDPHEPPAAGRSLKTQQHAESLCDSVVRNRRFLTRCSPPGVAAKQHRAYAIKSARNQRFLARYSPPGEYRRFGRHV